MVNKVFTLFDFSNGVVSSTPDILDIIESHTIKSKTTLSFSPLIYSSACCKWFRLSSAENSIVDKNTSMIGSWDKFLNWMIFVSDIERNSCEFDWLIDVFAHLLTSQVIIITCEINDTIDAIGKHSVVISGWNQIHRGIQRNLHWNTLRPFSTQCSFVITSKSISFAIGGQNYRVQTSACDFVHTFFVQRIYINILIVISFFFRFIILVIVQIKLL